MLSRLLPKPSHFRLVTLLCTKTQSLSPNSNRFTPFLRQFSANRGDNGDGRDPPVPNGMWSFSRESEGTFDPFGQEESGGLGGITDNDARTAPSGDGRDSSSSDSIWSLSQESEGSLDALFGREESGGLGCTTKADAWTVPRSPRATDDPWLEAGGGDGNGEDVFKGIETGVGEKHVRGVGNDEEWATAEGYKPWNLEEVQKDDVFDVGDATAGAESIDLESDRSDEDKELEREEEVLTAELKGPNRAFGDLIAASGITDAMLDSLIALKDFEGVEGLPPLREIEEWRYEKNTRRSTRAEIERQKQEEVAKARVRQVDDKGRAYGTGRRKCSIARVWVQPGNGKFTVNDKEFDIYFPMLDHRAALLRPFAETKTLGLWDVKCTVKGGGVSGQVGAIQLGISRALQNWEPGLRPPLRAGGFLTRDPRVVERKKPGKAKARKSFQWVKR